ncbi:membrane dipeptidase [Xanthovirga aplysinae]|uniref:membrane dipeptidase n=1 Tax=Xanthovirga aplysinae TaxID=2529853 RepID=UPI0012BC89AC|nr:membrane dipeptidase [Xanthovirga aplysinae]MTI30826.1 hypothetical protein [Xanthovirga aplysinae]
MEHIDIHCHSILKSFLGKEEKTDSWSSYKAQPEIFFNILNSQSSFSQLKKGAVKLVVVVLHCVEREVLRNWYARFVARIVGRYDIPFLRDIINKKYSYRQLLDMQIEHLRKIKGIKVINSIEEYEPDKNHLHVIASIEGAHNLYGKDSKSRENKDEIVLRNFSHYKKQGNPRLFYITPAHLVDNVLCTHAYAMKIIKDPTYMPKGCGLTSTGKRFIRNALENKTGKPVLIDIKHMSLQSRLEYYQLRREEFPDRPIIATHMGVTGISYKNIPVSSFTHSQGEDFVGVDYLIPKGLGGTTFNPWSINLYDEDIEEIILSKGLIGIILDQRILGLSINRKEYFSAEEFQNHYIHWMNLEADKQNVRQGIDLIKLITEKSQSIWHLKYLCNNILHIVKVGERIIGEKVWDMLCLGSDNDGAIKTIKNCKTAADYPKLKKGLLQLLPEMAEEAGIKIKNISGKVNNIMYYNALNFLKKHYT